MPAVKKVTPLLKYFYFFLSASLSPFIPESFPLDCQGDRFPKTDKEANHLRARKIVSATLLFTEAWPIITGRTRAWVDGVVEVAGSRKRHCRSQVMKEKMDAVSSTASIFLAIRPRSRSGNGRGRSAHNGNQYRIWWYPGIPNGAYRSAGSERCPSRNLPG